MSNIVPLEVGDLGHLMHGFKSFMAATGIEEILGGPDVLDEGLRQLSLGAMPLAAELVTLTEQGWDLSDIVNDPDGAPHTCRVHGFVEDLLTMRVPQELEPWARKLWKMVPPPEVTVMRKGIVTLAVNAANPMARALGRFFVFEAVCMIQRLDLLDSGVHLEVLDGSRGDVEVIAESELRILEEASDYQKVVVDLDDPLFLLQVFGLKSMDKHIEGLRREVTLLTREMHERLEKRRELCEVAARLDPKDGVVLLNYTAETLGTQELAAHQLRARHPGHLSDVGDAAVWKRKERLPEKVARLDNNPAATKDVTFADLILEAAQGQPALEDAR